MAAAAAPAAGQAQVVVTRLDGAAIAGVWSVMDAEAVTVIADGRRVRTPLADLDEIRFAGRAASAAPNSTAPELSATDIGAAVHTVGGGRIFGELADIAAGEEAGGARGAIALRVPRRGRWTISFKHLAAVRLASPQSAPEAAAIFDAARADRLAAEDTLITRDAEGAKSARGILESLGRREGTFHFGGRSRSFQVKNLYGVVFAAGSGAASPDRSNGAAASPLALLELTDGSAWPGRVQSAWDDGFEFEPDFGGRLSVSVEEVTRLAFGSGRVVYLSDMQPASETFRGVLHRAWPAGRDRSAGGGPLTLDGRTFAKGLGAHAHSELTYELAGRFEIFAAVIGIDDAVRPGGSVAFRVLGDGRTLFEGGVMTGRDDGRPVRVPVSGVNTLTLVVTDGDGLDLADHADWADARVIRRAADAGP